MNSTQSSALVIFAEEWAEGLKAGPTVYLSDEGADEASVSATVNLLEFRFPASVGEIVAEFILLVGAARRDELVISVRNTPPEVCEVLESDDYPDAEVVERLRQYSQGVSKVYVVETYFGTVLCYAEFERIGEGFAERLEAPAGVGNAAGEGLED